MLCGTQVLSCAEEPDLLLKLFPNWMGETREATSVPQGGGAGGGGTRGHEHADMCWHWSGAGEGALGMPTTAMSHVTYFHPPPPLHCCPAVL